LLALRQVKPHAPITFGDKVPRDAVGLVVGERTAHATILKVREGKLIGKDDYDFTITRNTSESDILETVLRSFYGHTYDIPREILMPGRVEEVEAFVDWFREKRGAAVAVFKPDRGPKRSLVAMARRNAELEFSRHELLPRASGANVELGKILGLRKPPRRIEGIDISHISGKQAVGAIVVFSDQRPLKSEYRRFKVRTVAGPDDCAMMAEVLRRRVKRLSEEKQPFADLLLVDGGKGQLSTAVAVYRESGLKMPILGFAKRTDLIYYVDGREIQIPASSPALRLLKQIRDEAHRFAITFHRKLRGKAMKDSALDHLSGVGAKRKLALIRHFGALDRIRDAGVAELRQVPDIGPALAQKIHDALHG